MDKPSEKDLVYLGRCDFRNQSQLFGLKRKDRRQHTYVIGKTGTGKSTFLHNLIVQDIENGEGLSVVDPHGELVESVLEKIPESRKDDIIYFNPADSEYHVGFNPLEIPDPKYKHLIASGLMSIFTKLWANVWSARMEYILNNAILALADTPGTTLLGVNRILVDKDYRQTIIGNLKDPVVRAFWVHEYEEWRDQFRNEAIAPIQNKVGQFLSTALIRNIVGQQKSTLDIFKVMNEGKILLINLSKGKIGEDNSSLLGSMLITKIQLAAMERVRIPEEERIDFYLYVDEFQNFATDSFANILSEARKYRLDLILAHQYIGQLVTENSTTVRDAVFGNTGTMIMFRVGATDADFLEQEFEPEFTPEDMVNLPNYCVYLKLMVGGITSRPFSATTLPPFKIPTTVLEVEEIIKNSREKYARPSQIVEDEISSWSATITEGTTKVEATCDVCGKETTLNFEPTPGKPIYCINCLKKVKEGKMAKIPEERDFKREKAKFKANLSAIGIDIVEERRNEEENQSPARAMPTHAGGATQAGKPQEHQGGRGRQEGNRPHQDNRNNRGNWGQKNQGGGYNQNNNRPQNQRYQREPQGDEGPSKKSVIDALEEKFEQIESGGEQKEKKELTLKDLAEQKEEKKEQEKPRGSSKDVESLRKNLRQALTKQKGD